MKYKYVGKQPALLIEYHTEVQPNDVVEVDGVLNNVFFVPVEDEKKSKDKPKEDAN